MGKKVDSLFIKIYLIHPMKYKKRVIVIEATQWFKNGDHPDDDVMRKGFDELLEKLHEYDRCKHLLDSLQKAAVVWRFDDAPEVLQDLSTNGGDEDWVVEVPPHFDQYIGWGWMMRIDSCNDPKEYAHPTKPGWKVLIGSHA